MNSTAKEIQVLENFFDTNSPKVNLKILADFFGKSDADIAIALDLDPSAVSRNPLATPDGKVKTWLSIFNLIIEIISEADPSLSAEQIKSKMQKWLVLPRPEFDSQTPLEYMLKGKSRKVKMFLEQQLG
ncbi:hypothetical protein [Bdellovibrio sp. KM01]|uniref:hypothetical protein n=1 Tax=Bdellovibrio sp. KM01 TaxID=2748865 RepID=UPI0015E8F50B|nr:hypothetical protein [Bdellovibrio sp. KM01]QLY25277.1 hypothetical protein HW988_17965 [Bdellovibrio sp. KM01]